MVGGTLFFWERTLGVGREGRSHAPRRARHVAGRLHLLDVAARTDPRCRRRIFLGTIDARLVALDAATGLPCADFGRSGQVDLSEG